MEENFMVGDVVKSLSGHDQNRLFIDLWKKLKNN